MTQLAVLYAGTLRSLEPEGHSSGIFKRAVPSAEITLQGILGDHQADRRFHGGAEKALHQFAVSSYQAIHECFPELATRAVPGSFGENVSCPELSDRSVCIGDAFRFGKVVVQVSQPRNPCWKINHKFGQPALSRFVEDHQLTGWYYRVLEPGFVTVGEDVELLDRQNEALTIAEFVSTTKQHRPNLDSLTNAIQCIGLNSELKRRLENRLQFLRKIVR